MSKQEINEMKEINPENNQLGISTPERQERKEINLQLSQSDNKFNIYSKIMIKMKIKILEI